MRAAWRLRALLLVTLAVVPLPGCHRPTPPAPTRPIRASFVYLESSPRDPSQARLISLSLGGAARPLSGYGTYDPAVLALSPDGNTAALLDSDHRLLYVVSLATGRAARVSAPPGLRYDTELRWSPQGDAIACTAGPKTHDIRVGGWPQLLGVIDVATSRLHTAVRLTPALRSPAWSPDGTRPAFVSEAGLETVSRDGRTHSVVITAHASRGAASSPSEPTWAPSGLSLALLDETVESGSPVTYLCLADGAGRVQRLTKCAFARPQWSPDGRYLLYEAQTSGGGSAMAIWDVQSDRPLALPPATAALHGLAWSHSQDSVLAARLSQASSAADLLVVAVPSGAETKLLTVTAGMGAIEWRD